MRNTLALCWALLSLCVAAADAFVGAAEPIDVFIGTEGLGHVSPAACASLEVAATGNFLGVFGEADERALAAEVRADGRKVATFRGYHGAGPGRLFFWRTVLLDGWRDGASRVHAFAVDPVPSGDPKGEFRIGSVCTATLVPSAGAGGSPSDATDAAAALEALDHARGQ